MNEKVIYLALCIIFFSFIYYIFRHFNYNSKSKKINLLIQILFLCIAFFSLIMSVNNFYYSRKIQKNMIIPELQVKPISIEDHINLTMIRVDILNYSEYTAKNIFLDIKFPDKPWRNELIKAAGKDSGKFITMDKETAQIIENMNNLPTWEELKPGKSVILRLGDENKEFLSKQKIFFSNSDGLKIPIPFNETVFYKRSQDWQGELKNLESGQPINVLFRVSYSNEIGRKFDRIKEYKLICTKIGTGRTYIFIPTGVVIEDI